MQSLAPAVLDKLQAFAVEAWAEARWGDRGGPLDGMECAAALSVRLVESWEYSVGGGLFDKYHHDTDSVLTIVALLCPADDYQGAVFCTNEEGDVQCEHPMGQGDVLCFVSHKYHNITPLTQGRRRSLVMELWEGGVGHTGRGD
jgi:hypothetical protein